MTKQNLFYFGMNYLFNETTSRSPPRSPNTRALALWSVWCEPRPCRQHTDRWSPDGRVASLQVFVLLSSVTHKISSSSGVGFPLSRARNRSPVQRCLATLIFNLTRQTHTDAPHHAAGLGEHDERPRAHAERRGHESRCAGLQSFSGGRGEPENRPVGPTAGARSLPEAQTGVSHAAGARIPDGTHSRVHQREGALRQDRRGLQHLGLGGTASLTVISDSPKCLFRVKKKRRNSFFS